MAAPMLVAGAVGTVMSAVGAAQSGAAQSQQFEYQAGIAGLRSKIALQNRDYVLGAGETEAAQYGLKARNVAGKILATQGASGLDVGGGSAVAVRQGQQLVTDLDMATIRNNAARKAYGYEVEATTDNTQAEMYSNAASGVRKATPFNVAATLLTGSSSVAGKWLQYGSTFGGGSAGADNVGNLGGTGGDLGGLY